MTLAPPTEVLDIFLNPGELYFGGPNIRVRTLLGSCVSIILWHPRLNIGGMCHYLLATRGDKKSTPGLEGKFGDDAFAILSQSAKAHFAPLNEYVAKIFGGSNMFSKTEKVLLGSSTSANSMQVGIRNIEFARDILNQNSIKIISENTGGVTSRKVFFTIWDGEVWLESHQEI
jgi:chemotaxis protein CheD